MKKTVVALLVFCLSLFPICLNAASTSDEIDLSKYTTLNLKDALAQEEIDMKYTDYKETNDQAVIYLFRGKGCTYCRAFLNFLNNYNDKKFKENFFLAGHMNAAGYRLTALMVESYIDYIIRNNLSEFKDVQFIGTDLHF